MSPIAIQLIEQNRASPPPCGRLTHRRGYTVVEVLIAVVLLGLTVVMTARFVSSLNQGLRDRELQSRLAWEIENAREQIGSWPPAEITSERIAELKVSEAVQRRCQNAFWAAELSKIESPGTALQIALTLRCTMHGQAVEPQKLTFWVPISAAEGDIAQ